MRNHSIHQNRGADRGARAGSPRGVVVATGSFPKHSIAQKANHFPQKDVDCCADDPVAPRF
jgi:hypothetical protein